jgi:hypothetical protein
LQDRKSCQFPFARLDFFEKSRATVVTVTLGLLKPRGRER